MFKFFKDRLKYLKSPYLIFPALFYKFKYYFNFIFYSRKYRNLFQTILNLEGLIFPLDAVCLYKAVLRNKEKEGDILDFGSYKGLSTCVLSQAAAKLKKNVITFESFKGLPPPSYLDKNFKEGEYKAAREEFINNVTKWGVPENIRLVQGDATKTLKDELKMKRITSFSFAFIDIDLYATTKEILFLLAEIAKGEEIIYVHDIPAPGIQAAIKEFVDSCQNKVFIRSKPTPYIAELVFKGDNKFYGRS